MYESIQEIFSYIDIIINDLNLVETKILILNDFNYINDYLK